MYSQDDTSMAIKLVCASPPKGFQEVDRATGRNRKMSKEIN